MTDSKTDELKKRLYELHREREEQRFADLDDRVDKLEIKSSEKRECTQIPLLGSLQDQIKENSKANKRMLTWQAGVGISLLLFFISVGLAWFRYVDKISYETESNKDKIEDIQEELDKHEQRYLENQEELKKLLDRLLNK